MEPERVLVVDDDEALLHLLTIALRRSGYQVESAGDGLAALEMLRSQAPFSVLLTDLMMPGMSGLELLREARQHDPHLEVIVITAAGTLESAISALRANGAYDYLLKPLESMSQLAVVVDRAISHRRLLLEREALQAQMQLEAERLKALISNTGDAILAADTGGLLTIANPAAARLLKQDDLVGNEASARLPTMLAKLVSNWQVVGSQVPAVVEVPWDNGSVQMVSLTPVFSGNGHSQGWVMVLNDITHLKRLDELKAQMLSEALRKLQLPLAQAVNDLAELNALASQDGRIAQIIYRMTTVWERIQEWGDHLKTLASVGTDLEVHLESIDLPSTLSEILRGMEKELIRERGLKLELNLPQDLSMVHSDPDLLVRLLQGLIKRAATRSEYGDTIHLVAREFENQVWVDVCDDGPPVSDADLPHIFDKSIMTPETASWNIDLDMAMVKTIIDRMGGQVWVGGQGPKGSTVTICLPAVAQPVGNQTR